MDRKKLGKKLRFPPVWLMAVLSVVSAGVSIAVMTKEIRREKYGK